MAIELREKLVLLCEGEADKNFFTALISARNGLPKFDIPFPNKVDAATLHGSSAFGGMLRAIRGAGFDFKNIEGVLIVADSATKPNDTFRTICKQIRQPGGFPIPHTIDSVAPRTEDHPAVAIKLLPALTKPGGLETLCVEALSSMHPWLMKCVDEFLTCGGGKALTWSPEKQDKAKYAAMVAASNSKDPGKAVSRAFEGSSPLINPNHRTFDVVEAMILDFANTVGVT